MTLLPCVVLLHIPFVCASLPSLNDTIIHTLDASDCPSCNTRTLWDILLSCGLTLFACTWTAIHPNVPGMDDGKFTVASRRLFVMTITMIAPELMIIWAAAQFFCADEVAKDFNDAFRTQIPQTHGDHENISECTATLLGQIPESSPSPGAIRPAEFREWTVMHGFFAWMGGFMLYVNGKPRATLTPHELLQFVREGSVDMPVIAEADMEDRSKGDALSKGIAVLQLLWFVLQFVARRAENLPTTLLEIDTLAIAALTCVAYCLWWKKPKDIGRPHIVHWKATALPPSDLSYDEADWRFSKRGCSLYLFYLIYPFMNLMGTSTIISPRAAHSRRVPSLRGYGEYHVRRAIPARRPVTSIIGCCCGGAFGAIHCLGWNFLFRTHAEQILWRAASLGVICAPIFVFIAWGDRMYDRHMTESVFSRFIKLGSRSSQLIAYCIRGGIGIATLTYITARTTIVVLMMLSLRSPPPGVYDTVGWTEFVPHL